MTLKEQIDQLYGQMVAKKKAIDSIDGSARGENRKMTPTEAKKSETLLNEMQEFADERKSLVNQLELGRAAAATLDMLAAGESDDHDGTRRLALAGSGAKSQARGYVNRLRERSGGQKALITAGTMPIPMPTTAEPVPIGRPVQSLLGALTAIPTDTPVYLYGRQVVRTNNAAVVAPGALKPTSVTTIEPIHAELQMIAHLTEPIDEFLLRDSETLGAFIERDMFWGIHAKLQAYIVGPAADPAGAIPSLQSISGVLQQAYVTDVLTTLRSAMTKLEVAGNTPGIFSLHPSVWEAIETARNTSGQFDMGPAAPIDAAARRIWGVPVALVPEQDEAVGLLIDTNTIAVHYGDEGIESKWTNGGELFDRNQMKGRVEGRFQVDYLQPGGNVVIDLTAA